MTREAKSAAQERFEAKVLARIDEYIAAGRPLPPDLAMAAALLRLEPAWQREKQT